MKTKPMSKALILFAVLTRRAEAPLAGDVYAAAVILPKGYVVEGVNDSKKLSEKKREALFDKIVDECICYSVGTASVEEIDEINILQATFLAMRQCS